MEIKIEENKKTSLIVFPEKKKVKSKRKYWIHMLLTVKEFLEIRLHKNLQMWEVSTFFSISDIVLLSPSLYANTADYWRTCIHFSRSRVLVLDCSSEHVAYMWRKISVFWREKFKLNDCCRWEQMPLTDQMT